jgi:diadenosine tetraphosphate (Ap4A) HIT family hydrolase
LAIWDYRLLDENPITDSLRFRVLKDSGGRCALCGASKHETSLDVDHIIPRSKRGKTEYENLQVLCAKCNRSKRDQDSTDFRNDLTSNYKQECEFCRDEVNREIIISNDLCKAFLDKYSVTEGHTLVVPKRHVSDYFEMSEAERTAANDLLRIRRKQLMESDNSIQGFNVGMNCGESAGQTIKHGHIHLIPRRFGDMDNPEGGVRGVIPGKARYR